MIHQACPRVCHDEMSGFILNFLCPIFTFYSISIHHNQHLKHLVCAQVLSLFSSICSGIKCKGSSQETDPSRASSWRTEEKGGCRQISHLYRESSVWFGGLRSILIPGVHFSLTNYLPAFCPKPLKGKPADGHPYCCKAVI